MLEEHGISTVVVNQGLQQPMRGKPPRTLADKMGPLDTVFRDIYGRGQFMPPAGKTAEDMPKLHRRRVRAAQDRGTLKKND